MKDLLPKLAISGLGSGYLRPAPGTWGSMGACVVFLLLFHAAGDAGYAAAQIGAAAILLASSVACVAYGRWAERQYGCKDPSHCTADEWAGQSLALLALPAVAAWPIHWSVLGAFVAFRLFDIVKLSPARRAERLPAGWGILLDDLVSGVYANVACQLAMRALVAWRT